MTCVNVIGTSIKYTVGELIAVAVQIDLVPGTVRDGLLEEDIASRGPICVNRPVGCNTIPGTNQDSRTGADRQRVSAVYSNTAAEIDCP